MARTRGEILADYDDAVNEFSRAQGRAHDLKRTDPAAARRLRAGALAATRAAAGRLRDEAR